MPDAVFDRVVIPVASKMDAQRTCEAVLPHLHREGGEAHVVHVIEEAGGAPDKASVEQRHQYAERIFDVIIKTFTNADFTAFETHLRYGTDVAATIRDACDESNATAVVFVTRETSRWKRFLTGDVALKLITKNRVPAVVLPESEEQGDSAPD